jgi:hypothetical protein
MGRVRVRVCAPRISAVVGVLCALMLAITMGTVASVARASYVAPSPAWRVSALAAPTSFSLADTPRCETNEVSDCDSFSAVVTNVGSGSSREPIRITLSTTTGVTVMPDAWVSSEGVGIGAGKSLCVPASGSEVTCELPGPVRPGGVVGMRVAVEVASGTSVAEGNFAVEGGGAVEAGHANVSSPIDGAVSPGINDFQFEVLGRNGERDLRAGDHPTRLLDEVGVASTLEKDPQQLQAQPLMGIEEPRTIMEEIPVGFLGNTQVTPKCSPSALVEGPFESRCPADTQIGGFAFVGLGGLKVNATARAGGLYPIYNLKPENGYPAEFGINFDNQPVIFYASVVFRDGNYRLRVTAPGVPRVARPVWLMTEFFGEPGAWDRGLPTAQETEEEEEAIENEEPVRRRTSEAFLTNPVDCSQESTGANAQVVSWTTPDPEQSPKLQVGVGDRVGECDLLKFAPSLQLTSESAQSGVPSGYTASLSVPEALNEAPVPATPELRNATVTTPVGTIVSPSAANGLDGCEPIGQNGINIGEEHVAQDGMSHMDSGHCPSSSKIGTAEIKTPLLPAPLVGSVFLREPECGTGSAPACGDADAEDGKLLGLYLEVEGSGTIIKVAGTVSVNIITGQLTTTFDENPQFPFSELKLKFFGGARAALVTPRGCGTYTTTSDLTPWSSPFTADATPSGSFMIDEGCAASGFSPRFTAGTINGQAGAYSPFTLAFSRGDTEQDFQGLQATLPPGLLAKLADVQLCGEAEANVGACPGGSQIGTVTVGAGAGPDPYYVGGKIYLTGAYNGGAFGEVVEVPAIAGPFNLGTVVVRGSIRINPTTAQASVVSNPFPSILDGVPLQIKTVSVTLNRSGFTFNSTNCQAQSINATLTSTAGAGAVVSSPFQAANCANLPFKPSFTASTARRASKAGGASLDVKISSKGGPQPGGGEANIKSVKVDLPKQLPSRLTTLQKACVDTVFDANPAACPKESNVGTATAVTPILAHPLVGPAYLVSHGGVAFPDLEIVLQGEGITLVVDGNTNIKKGITSSTFRTVPDAPINSFELMLPTGKYSVLTTNLPASANYSLCGQTLAMPTVITGQNGAVIKQTTKIAISGCPKKETLTRAQRLGKALKVCKKDKKKAKRSSCERRARERYGPLKKKKSTN